MLPDEIMPTREAIVMLRTSGMTRSAIALHFDVPMSTVRRWIKHYGIPRPVRKGRKTRTRNMTSTGEIIADTPPEYTSIEWARIRLGPRLIERRHVGYILDGTPADIDTILHAAGIEVVKIW